MSIGWALGLDAVHGTAALVLVPVFLEARSATAGVHRAVLAIGADFVITQLILQRTLSGSLASLNVSAGFFGSIALSLWLLRPRRLSIGRRRPLTSVDRDESRR